MSKLTVEACIKEQGDNYKSGYTALWEVGEDADAPLIPVEELTTLEGQFGPYSFFKHPKGNINLLGILDPKVATYKIVEVVATRDREKVALGMVSHRVVAA